MQARGKAYKVFGLAAGIIIGGSCRLDARLMFACSATPAGISNGKCFEAPSERLRKA